MPDKIENRVEQLDSEVRVAATDLEEIEAQLVKLKQESQREISNLERQLVEVEDTISKEMLTAPVAGIVYGMVPSSPGYAAAAGETLVKVVPGGELEAKIFVTNKDVTSESINDAMSKAANGPLKGILATNSAPLVSKDFNHNPHSSIFDLTQTQVIKGKFSRVLSWYDNEWGFSNRMCDTAIQIAGLI